MTKQEFEKRIGTEISQKDYSIVEYVYTWHPSINEVEGKKQMTELYKSFGMPIIKNMMETANYAETLEREMTQAQRQVEELRKRIIRVAKGDLVVEQCITEAKKLFETVNDPHGWDMAVSYLKKRYGADAVDEAIKTEHLEMQEGSESMADRSNTRLNEEIESKIRQWDGTVFGASLKNMYENSTSYEGICEYADIDYEDYEEEMK